MPICYLHKGQRTHVPLLQRGFMLSTILVPSASLYGEMKRYKESEKMFRKALKLNPQYTEAYFNLG